MVHRRYNILVALCSLSSTYDKAILTTLYTSLSIDTPEEG
jgi:hypothetical protein